jgi:hypothetical protein
MQEASKKLTDQEKRIYNKFHAVTRSSQNKPFKLRKDFDGFEDKYPDRVFYVKKLALFFTRFPHVSVDEFFKAPYDIYQDRENQFDLKFYTSQRALKVYTMYNQKNQLKSPDSDDQLISIRKSLEFILKFCDSNNIAISEYINHPSGNIPSYIMHMKQCKVNVYVLFGFEGFENSIQSSDAEHVAMILGDFGKMIPNYRTAFMSSKLAKKLVRSGISKIKELQSKVSTV